MHVPHPVFSCISLPHLCSNNDHNGEVCGANNPAALGDAVRQHRDLLLAPVQQQHHRRHHHGRLEGLLGGGSGPLRLRQGHRPWCHAGNKPLTLFSSLSAAEKSAVASLVYYLFNLRKGKVVQIVIFLSKLGNIKGTLSGDGFGF